MVSLHGHHDIGTSIPIEIGNDRRNRASTHRLGMARLRRENRPPARSVVIKEVNRHQLGRLHETIVVADQRVARAEKSRQLGKRVVSPGAGSAIDDEQA